MKKILLLVFLSSCLMFTVILYVCSLPVLAQSPVIAEDYFRSADEFLLFLRSDDKSGFLAEKNPLMTEDHRNSLAAEAEDLWSQGFILPEVRGTSVSGVYISPGTCEYYYLQTEGVSSADSCRIGILETAERSEISQIGLHSYRMRNTENVAFEYEITSRIISVNGKDREFVIARIVDGPSKDNFDVQVCYGRYLLDFDFYEPYSDEFLESFFQNLTITEIGAPASDTNLQWYWILLIAFSVVILTVIVTVLFLRRRKKAKAVLCASGGTELLEELPGEIELPEEVPKSSGPGAEDPPKDTE